MSLYSSYSDDDLALEIEDLKARIIAAGKSDKAGVRVIAGEGRRVEFNAGGAAGANVAGLRDLLAAAELEWNVRNGGEARAIGVRF